MSYCTLGKLRTALAPGVFTDNSGPPNPPSGTAADLPDAQLLDAIAEADATIDAAIGAHYATPVAAVDGAAPHPIDYWSRAIAAYLATCTLRGSLDFSNDDPIYRRYLVAAAALSDVKNGKGVLSSLATNTDPDSSGSGASAPVNPYTGNLFAADDFNLAATPGNFGYGMNRYAWWGNDSG